MSFRPAFRPPSTQAESLYTFPSVGGPVASTVPPTSTQRSTALTAQQPSFSPFVYTAILGTRLPPSVPTVFNGFTSFTYPLASLEHVQPCPFPRQAQPPLLVGYPLMSPPANPLGNYNESQSGGVAAFVPPGPDGHLYGLAPRIRQPRNSTLSYRFNPRSSLRGGPAGIRCTRCMPANATCDPVTVLQPNGETFPSCYRCLDEEDTHEGRLCNRITKETEANARKKRRQQEKRRKREGNRARMV